MSRCKWGATKVKKKTSQAFAATYEPLCPIIYVQFTHLYQPFGTERLGIVSDMMPKKLDKNLNTWGQDKNARGYLRSTLWILAVAASRSSTTFSVAVGPFPLHHYWLKLVNYRVVQNTTKTESERVRKSYKD